MREGEGISTVRVSWGWKVSQRKAAHFFRLWILAILIKPSRKVVNST